jgi:hypothetical protein
MWLNLSLALILPIREMAECEYILYDQQDKKERNEFMNGGLTFGKRMLLGYLFVLSMMVAIGLMAFSVMTILDRKAQLADATNRSASLFSAIERCGHQLTLSAIRGDRSAELASNDWKKAKDKFLSEVNKLSQTESLGERERQMIKTIQDSWKEYDVSFRRYILAMQSAGKNRENQDVREQETALAKITGEILNATGELTNLATRSMDRARTQMEIWLSVALVTAVSLGLMIMLVNIRVWNRALGRAMHRLKRHSSEDMQTQADQIHQAMSELMDLVGRKTVDCREQDKDDVQSQNK